MRISAGPVDIPGPYQETASYTSVFGACYEKRTHPDMTDSDRQMLTPGDYFSPKNRTNEETEPASLGILSTCYGRRMPEMITAGADGVMTTGSAPAAA